jgi:hypothetical protein
MMEEGTARGMEGEEQQEECLSKKLQPSFDAHWA